MDIIITVQRTRDNDRGASPQVRRKPYSYPRTKQSFLENFTLRQWIDKRDSFALMVKRMRVYGHILGSFAVNPVPLAGTTIDCDEK